MLLILYRPQDLEMLSEKQQEIKKPQTAAMYVACCVVLWNSLAFYGEW